MKKIIPKRYFDELKERHNTVPRNEKTGDALPFKVSKEYTIGNDENKETVKARCTQDCPYNLQLIVT